MNKNSSKLEPLGKYLSIAYRALNSYLDRELEEYDIARGQLPFLIALYHKEGVSQQQLCKYYNLDKATAGRAISKLIDIGLVKREKDPEDRRQYNIYLTEKGREFKPLFLDILKSSEERMKKNLSEEELFQFMNTLEKIINNLGVEKIDSWCKKE